MYEKWIGQLLKVELFQNIKKEELENMLNCLKPKIRSYKNRDVITIEKDKMDGIGIILDGGVTVGKETLAGDRVIIAYLKKGEIFGEAAAFTGEEWLATVIAITDCTILFFPPQSIVGICNKVCYGHKVLIQNMLHIVSKKALILNKKVEILSLKSIRKKISTYLLQHYKKNNSLTFQIPLKRNELAEYILVTRPSLSRELINMQQEGIIDFHRNSFKILDLKGLKECLR
jgi:CRP-like cAMP-binding protein